MSLDSQVFFVFQKKKKRKTNTRNMLCCTILFCTFPEIQGVGHRKNAVGDGRSAFSVRGLEKPLGGMGGKRQGLSYFLSFFRFSPSFERKKKVVVGWRGASSSLVSLQPLLQRKQQHEESGSGSDWDCLSVSDTRLVLWHQT